MSSLNPWQLLLIIISTAAIVSGVLRVVRSSPQRKAAGVKYHTLKDPHEYAMVLAVLLTFFWSRFFLYPGFLGLAQKFLYYGIAATIAVEIIYILTCWFKPLPTFQK